MTEENSVIFNLDLGVVDDIVFPTAQEEVGPASEIRFADKEPDEEEHFGTPQEQFARLHHRAQGRLKEALESGSTIFLAEAIDAFTSFGDCQAT